MYQVPTCWFYDCGWSSKAVRLVLHLYHSDTRDGTVVTDWDISSQSISAAIFLVLLCLYSYTTYRSIPGGDSGKHFPAILSKHFRYQTSFSQWVQIWNLVLESHVLDYPSLISLLWDLPRCLRWLSLLYHRSGWIFYMMYIDNIFHRRVGICCVWVWSCPSSRLPSLDSDISCSYKIISPVSCLLG